MNAYEFLNENYILNVPIIEMLQRGEAKLLSADKYGVSAIHKEGLLLLSLTDANSLKRFEDKINEGLLTVFYGADTSDEIMQVLPQIKSVVPCRQIVYTKKESPLASGSNLDFKPVYRLLDASHTDFVFENYSRAWSKEHTKMLLSRGLIYGAYMDGALAGFVGRHTEGSMGMLEVLPAFRRKGLGQDLERFIIDVVLNENKTPYAHIVLGNDISLKLQNKIDGIALADKLVSWFRVER